MAIIFTSDTHFGHGNVINAEEMDAALIKQWNEKIGPNDTVWHLGDVSFSTRERTMEILSQLNGEKHLVLGNHDRRFRSDVNLRKFFMSIHDGIYEIKIGKQSYVLCHFPMMSWNKSSHGSIHLHGHCHGSIPFHPRVPRLDVGVDAHGPINASEIFAKLEM